MFEEIGRITVQTIEGDIDGLFALPLAEFTAARNSLAARLKREGRADKAEQVKALAKPSTSAWAVNQLYWKHRDRFERLMEAGQDHRAAQAAHLAGRAMDVQKPGDARRQAISELSHLAAGSLRDAGHNPTPDIMRRITTTLEALSAYATVPNASRLGRLTDDVEAPGFDALTRLFSGNTPERTKTAGPSITPSQSFPSPRATEEVRRKAIASAKAGLRDSQQNLSRAQAKAQSFVASLKAAQSDQSQAELNKHRAEEQLQKATIASEEAVRRLRDIEAQVEEAGQAVQIATRAVELATRELESLLNDRDGP